MQLKNRFKHTLKHKRFILTLALGLILFALTPISPIFTILSGIIFCVLSYQYPKTSLLILLIYIPFSGTIVYQFLGGNQYITIIQDFLYFPAIIHLILKERKKQPSLQLPASLQWTLWIFLGFTIATFVVVNISEQLLLPSEGEIPFMMGLIGLKVLLGYIPLIWGGYYLIRTQKDLYFWTRLFVVLVIVCCCLGIIQYGLLALGVCAGTRGLEGDAIFKASVDAKCFVGGALAFNPEHNVVRLPGTFPSVFHWTWFLISGAVITSASAWSDPVKVWKQMSSVGIILILFTTLLSGQNVYLIVISVFLVISWIALIFQWDKYQRRAILFSITLVVLMVILTNISGFNFIIEQFSWAAQSDPNLAWTGDQNLGFFGRGLGKATNNARMFGDTVLMETFYAKLLYEMGYLGLLSFLGFVTSLCWVVYQKMRSLSPSKYQGYALCIWLFLLLVSYNNYWSPLDTNPVNVYYWLWAGIALKLPILEGD